ncbi:MAG: hypothetical protein NVSMB32_04640 [Actinomycetota bacterium]
MNRWPGWPGRLARWPPKVSCGRVLPPWPAVPGAGCAWEPEGRRGAPCLLCDPARRHREDAAKLVAGRDHLLVQAAQDFLATRDAACTIEAGSGIFRRKADLVEQAQRCREAVEERALAGRSGRGGLPRASWADDLVRQFAELRTNRVVWAGERTRPAEAK